MAIVNVQGTGNRDRTKIMTGKETNRMIDESRRFPPKRDGITDKLPAGPLEPKKGETRRRKENMIIARLIIADG